MYENLVLLNWALLVIIVIGGVGAIIDVICIRMGRKITRAKKWIWNIVEMLAIWGLIIVPAVKGGLPWGQQAMLCISSWFVWRIVHDGFIGLGIANDFLYVGKGAWDSKMLATYQNSKWFYFIANKCVPLGLFLAGFLTW